MQSEAGACLRFDVVLTACALKLSDAGQTPVTGDGVGRRVSLLSVKATT